MIALDTNILARSILNDDKELSPLARNKMRSLMKKDDIFISSFSILELVWLMKIKKKTKETIVSVLAMLLNTSGIVIANDKVLRMALALYREGKADFGDYLILSESLQNGCEKVLTFDQTFSKEKLTELLKP